MEVARIKAGDRASCKHCEQDIEFHGHASWLDRGGNRQCPPYMDRTTGEVVRSPKTKHTPYKEQTMTTFPVTIDDGESEPVTIELPAQWAICNHCNGDGTSSAYLGSFTREDFHEDPDFAEEYMAGQYDRPCQHCEGSGKVREISRDACTTDEQKRALQHLDDEAAYKQESFAERKRESLMLGESTLRDWDGVEP